VRVDLGAGVGEWAEPGVDAHVRDAELVLELGVVYEAVQFGAVQPFVVQVVVRGVVEVVVQVGEYLVGDQVVFGEDGAGDDDQVQGERFSDAGRGGPGRLRSR
jgi:hypothetical protein